MKLLEKDWSKLPTPIKEFRALNDLKPEGSFDKKVFAQGVYLHGNDGVKSLRLNLAKKAFEGVVLDGEKMFHCWIIIVEKEIKHGCECRLHFNNRECPHVAALICALFQIVKEYPLSFVLPTRSHKEFLQDSLLCYWFKERSSIKSSLVKPKSNQLMLYYDFDIGSLDLHPFGDFPISLLIKMGARNEASGLNWGLDDDLYVDKLLKLIKKGEELGVKVFYNREGNKYYLQPNLINIYKEQYLELDNNSRNISLKLQFEYKGNCLINDEVLPVTDNLAIFKDGRIAKTLSRFKDFRYREFFVSPTNLEEQSFEKSDLINQIGCQSLSVEAFNESSLTLSLLGESNKPSAGIVSYKANEKQSIKKQSSELTHYPASLEVQLKDANYGMKGQICFSIFDSGGKRKSTLSLQPLIHRLSNYFKEFQNGVGHHRIILRKNRFQKIMEFLKLSLIQPDQENLSKIQKIIQKSFSSDALLNQIACDYLVEKWSLLKTDKTVPLLVVNNDQWGMITFPLRAFVILLLELYQAESLEDWLPNNKSEFCQISEDILFKTLQRVTLLCNSLKVSVFYNRMPLSTTSIEIRIDTSSTNELDWFELKPSIYCGDKKVNQNNWSELMSGKLLIENSRGFQMPQIKNHHAFKAFSELIRKSSVNYKTKGKNSNFRMASTISRLQIFDLIEMRKIGLKINLPDPLEKIIHNLKHLEDIPQYSVSKKLKYPLRDYQITGYRWIRFLLENRFGACLADDMGLGKTIQAIAFLSTFHENNPSAITLILVPPSLLFNWRNEFDKFCPSLRIGEYQSGEDLVDVTKFCQVLLTTYDLVRRNQLDFQKIFFDTLILDETQNLKNLQTARTKAIMKLRRGFTLCLTGTPLENHLSEYYSIMNLAVPGVFGTIKEFLKSTKQEPSRILNRAQPFILRRTKERILTELPSKEENNVYLEMNESQKSFYTQTISQVRSEVEVAYQKRPKQQAGIIALTALMRLRQVCISPQLLGYDEQELAPKLDYVIRKVIELHQERHSALLFSQFTQTLDLVEQQCQKNGVGYLRLDGKTSKVNRKRRVESFQSSSCPEVFLISLKAGGVGLNLTKASYVFHMDPWWNPAVENQASDRAHRLGQESKVFIQRLIMKDTIEEKMMALKKRKQELFDQVLENTQNSNPTKPVLTPKDFDFLIS